MSDDPVYSLKKFQSNYDEDQFYANTLPEHLKKHIFVNLPHKHDFYLVVYVTRGTGVHEIDFKKYNVKPGMIFLMQPGQMHHWEFSKDISGFVFFHSRGFYEEHGLNISLQAFEFFQSFQYKPHLSVRKEEGRLVGENMQAMIRLYKGREQYRSARLWAYLHLTYLEIASNYKGGISGPVKSYLPYLREFEMQIEKNYRSISAPSAYAEILGISAKHLNRICHECLGKTSTQVIADRFILEARRLLLTEGITVSEVSYDLNFSDISYFTRFFKKYTGITPSGFIKKYRS